jgi:hypothetical protein
MKLYKKEGNILQILSFSNENAEKGDYLLVEDPDARKAIIAQVIDVQFASIPGVLEELLRTLPDGGVPIQGEDIDPLDIAPHITYIQPPRLQNKGNTRKRDAQPQQQLAAQPLAVYHS